MVRGWMVNIVRWQHRVGLQYEAQKIIDHVLAQSVGWSLISMSEEQILLAALRATSPLRA